MQTCSTYPVALPNSTFVSEIILIDLKLYCVPSLCGFLIFISLSPFVSEYVPILTTFHQNMLYQVIKPSLPY